MVSDKSKCTQLVVYSSSPILLSNLHLALFVIADPHLQLLHVFFFFFFLTIIIINNNNLGECLKGGSKKSEIVIQQRVPLLYEGTVVIQLLLGR